MSTLDRAQRRYDNMEAPGYYDDDDGPPDPITREMELEKAYRAGFNAACEYWENPMRYVEVDINDHEEAELKKVLKLLG